MKVIFLILLLVHVLEASSVAKRTGDVNPSAGCKKISSIDASYAGQFHHSHMTSTNPSFSRNSNFYKVWRDYYVYIPSEYKSPRPLVIDLHSYFQTAAEQLQDGWVDVANEHNLFVVYPNGFGDFGRADERQAKPVYNSPKFQSWNIGSHFYSTNCLDSAPEYCYNSCASMGYCDFMNDTCAIVTCVDDRHFIANELIDAILEDYCINVNAVFVSGFSNGGMMANELGVSLFRSRFRAIFSSGGTPFEGTFDPNQNFRYPAAIILQGGNDSVTPINGIADASTDQYWWYYPFYRFVSIWSDINDCKTDIEPDLLHTNFDGSKEVSCLAFQNCRQPVVRCTFPGNHTYDRWQPSLFWEVWLTVSTPPPVVVPTWELYTVITFTVTGLLCCFSLTCYGMFVYHWSQTHPQLWEELKIDSEEI